MSIETESDLTSLLRVGNIVALTLRKMANNVRAGVTTGEIDAIGAEFMHQNGVRSAPMMLVGFPCATCISINDEAAHGIPGSRVIREGDLVKLDVTGELGGYYADAAITVAVPPVLPKRQKLLDCARAALADAISAARAGAPMHSIGTAAETGVRRRGFKVITDLTGHGVGRSMHEEPEVPNFYVSRLRKPLTDGLVLAVEPHVTTGRADIFTASDGWTLKTRDGNPVANFEHTIVVTKGRPIIVTA
ncbi:MAG: type I methionyl aminopeptidase [Chloroflexota bacterium]